MNIEEFALGNSWIHRLDPRVKIFGTLLFSIVVALNSSIYATAVSMLISLVPAVAARLDAKKILARLCVVNGFVVFLWFLLPFTHPGETILSVGPLSVSKEGVALVALITLKSNAIILMVISLLGTSKVLTLVHALSHMGVPEKIVHLFFFCFRYLHVIHEEYHRLMDAMRIRGFKPATTMHTYRSYAYLLGMLLIRSFDRSRRILAAMKCRGFMGRFYILHDYEMRRSDYAVAGSMVLFAICFLVPL